MSFILIQMWIAHLRRMLEVGERGDALRPLMTMIIAMIMIITIISPPPRL